MIILKIKIKKNLISKYSKRYFDLKVSILYMKTIKKIFNEINNKSYKNFDFYQSKFKTNKKLDYLYNIIINKTNFDEQYIVKLYRRFEVNLYLTKNIKSTKIKRSHNNANLLSYLYLAILIKKVKKINDLQKFNFYLKTFDIIYYNDSKFFHNYQLYSKIFLSDLNQIIEKYNK